MTVRKIHDVRDLKIFSDRVGPVYGTEDWCLFLYSVAKMHKPKTIVELGCGCAATTMWLAQAIKENESGHVWSVDDGRDWTKVLEGNLSFFLPEERKASFPDYFQFLSEKFDLKEHVTLLSRTMPPFPGFDAKIDLLFSDFAHGANDIIAILAHYLPQMAECSSIFIDSASTSFPSYALLELLIPQFNQGKVPGMLLDKTPEENRRALREFIDNKQFSLVHMTEVKQRAQNSTAWIRIQPTDIRPYPKAAFH